LTGSAGELIRELQAYQELGVSHLQLWIDPITQETIESFAPILTALRERNS
jgi:hypothetical protein